MDTLDSKTKFPYIPEGRQILYVPISNTFMQMARDVARLSNEQQQPTGAVVVSEGQVLSEASNKNPLTSKRLINLHKKYCIRHMFHIPSGEKYWLCPGCAGKESHAESRACKQIFGQTKTGPRDLYLWGHWWCCDTCWKNMIKAGIDNIYLLDESFELFNAKSPTNILGKQFPRV